MFAILEPFQIIFSIFILNYIGGLMPLASGKCIDRNDIYWDDCRLSTTFFLTNLQSLTIELRYDPGSNHPDYDLVKVMCEAREKFPGVAFAFIPGVSEKLDQNGKLVCPSQGGDAKDDCIYPIIEACASKIVTDFPEFLCCFYTASTDNKDADWKCVEAQNPDKVAAFESCKTHQNEDVKPEDVLVENSNNAKKAFPGAECPHPLIAFNGKFKEDCTRNAFRWDAKKVVCAMLAPGVEKACG